MLLIVHAIQVTANDIEVNAKFFHTVSTVRGNPYLQLSLIGKQMAIYSRKDKSRVSKFRHIPRSRLQWRQSFRAITINNVQTQTTHLPQQNQTLTSSNVTSVATSSSNVPSSEQPSPPSVVAPVLSNNKIILPPPGSDFNLCESGLGSSATVQQAAAWLQTNRFASFARTFANFSGLDLLRLSCDNLIQICGLPEGIRLFNALHKTSRLTVYLCVEANPDVYHAAYLAALSNEELKVKLASLLGMALPQIEELFLRGPNGIHIIISDDVVRNFKDESTYVIELLQGHAVDSYSLLLKPSLSALPLPTK